MADAGRGHMPGWLRGFVPVLLGLLLEACASERFLVDNRAADVAGDFYGVWGGASRDAVYAVGVSPSRVGMLLAKEAADRWTRVPTRDGGAFHGVWGVPSHLPARPAAFAIAVGAGGRTAVMSDIGISRTPFIDLPRDPGPDLFCVTGTGLSPGTIWTAGARGTILRSTADLRWEPVTSADARVRAPRSIADVSLYGIAALPEGKVFVVGGAGTIIERTLGESG